MNREIKGAKLLLIETDGSQTEIPKWHKSAIFSDHVRVVDNLGNENIYPIPPEVIVLQPLTTLWGVMIQKDGTLNPMDVIAENESLLRSVNLKTIRLPFFFGQTTTNEKTIDKYLADGFNVAINFNFLSTESAVPFPADSTMIRSKAEYFFNKYAPKKNQIPFVTIENEWDNIRYHLGGTANLLVAVPTYLNELSICTEVGHKYGFKIADAGITSTSLRRWMYSVLTGDEQTKWANQYFTAHTRDDYNTLVNTVNQYCLGAVNIPFDFSNTHWYNDSTVNGGFDLASKTFAMACSKQSIYRVNNEFGVKNTAVWSDTVKEIAGNVAYGIAYSGQNKINEAVLLSPEMLNLLS